MVDYKKDTGSSGQMMIRDTGSVVEFWITSGNSTTFANDMPWGYTVNGNTNNDREYRYSAGAGWEKLGSWNVTSDQTVTFRLFATGTSGLGGPTTLTADIERASAPSPPSPVGFSNKGSTSVHVTFSDGASNGASIDARQIAYNTVNTVSGATHVSSDKSTTITGLTPGRTYFVWARTHNSKGWSGYSAVRSFTTLRTPDVPSPVTLSEITQSSMRAFFTGGSNGGSPVLEWQLAWNTVNTVTGASTMATNGTSIVTGLTPGTTYYFWARARNAVGWSAYSPVRSAKTLAGVRIKVGGVWVQAIPYVKHEGVWKVARPWARVAGTWRETL